MVYGTGRTGMQKTAAMALAFLGLVAFPALAANPIVPGWYADPEIRIFAHQYWIYPTFSAEATPTASAELSDAQKTTCQSEDMVAFPEADLHGRVFLG